MSWKAKNARIVAKANPTNMVVINQVWQLVSQPKLKVLITIIIHLLSNQTLYALYALFTVTMAEEKKRNKKFLGDGK